MITLEEVLAKMGMPCNFKGGVMEAMQNGVRGAYAVIMDHLEQEKKSGKEEMDTKSNQETRRTKKILRGEEGQKDPNEVAK